MRGRRGRDAHEPVTRVRLTDSERRARAQGRRERDDCTSLHLHHHPLIFVRAPHDPATLSLAPTLSPYTMRTDFIAYRQPPAPARPGLPRPDTQCGHTAGSRFRCALLLSLSPLPLAAVPCSGSGRAWRCACACILPCLTGPAPTPRPSWAAAGSTGPLRGLGIRDRPCPK